MALTVNEKKKPLSCSRRSPFHNPTMCILYSSSTWCGKQGFPSAQPYLSHIFYTVNTQFGPST
ncbi:hypothetical protein N7465_001057 [Penicillium sp. CMV-2018d]|nr:hypothetical protein N7465_001057 [Penicillium sp. CMV-2018d]